MGEKFDLIVIGAGPAGEKGAAQAAYFGKRVAIIEKAAEPGGAAVHTGTLPSKTLRETALYLSGYHARDLYGVSVALDDPQASVPHLIARKNAIAAVESKRMRDNFSRHHIEYVEGYARFVDATHVSVEAKGGTRVLEGDQFLITTGSRPLRPEAARIDEPDVYDSDEILEIDALPRKLVVLGAGVIGCEYACMFAALGVEVTLVEGRPNFLSFLDDELVGHLRAAMEKLGIVFRFGAKWTEVDHDPKDGLYCALDDGSKIFCDKLLFAAGRVGNAQNLGLETIGLAPDARGYLKVDENYRTSVPNVFAAGDVIGFPALASTSMEQARVAVCEAFQLHSRARKLGALPYGIYTIPEVSAVGETEETCKARGIDYVVGRAFYRDNARGQITGDLDGVTKLIVDPATRKILGVHVIGERASELVHIGDLAMHLDGTVDVFVDMVFNYPTLSESFKYAAYSALGEIAKRGHA